MVVETVPLFIIGKIMCASVTVYNGTTNWQRVDQQNLDSAIKRCERIYEDSPCLKTFIKVEEGVYRAICGETTKRHKK